MCVCVYNVPIAVSLSPGPTKQILVHFNYGPYPQHFSAVWPKEHLHYVLQRQIQGALSQVSLAAMGKIQSNVHQESLISDQRVTIRQTKQTNKQTTKHLGICWALQAGCNVHTLGKSHEGEVLNMPRKLKLQQTNRFIFI
jgi:hypothetical protein